MKIGRARMAACLILLIPPRAQPTTQAISLYLPCECLSPYREEARLSEQVSKSSRLQHVQYDALSFCLWLITEVPNWVWWVVSELASGQAASTRSCSMRESLPNTTQSAFSPQDTAHAVLTRVKSSSHLIRVPSDPFHKCLKRFVTHPSPHTLTHQVGTRRSWPPASSAWAWSCRQARARCPVSWSGCECNLRSCRHCASPHSHSPAHLRQIWTAWGGVGWEWANPATHGLGIGEERRDWCSAASKNKRRACLAIVLKRGRH